MRRIQRQEFNYNHTSRNTRSCRPRHIFARSCKLTMRNINSTKYPFVQVALYPVSLSHRSYTPLFVRVHVTKTAILPDASVSRLRINQNSRLCFFGILLVVYTSFARKFSLYFNLSHLIAYRCSQGRRLHF